MSARDVLSADLVLVGGKILTMDPRNTVAQAVAVSDGKIVAVGSDRDLQSLAESARQVVELDGRTVLPGLVDCHVHLASDAVRSAGVVECRDLYEPSIEAVGDIAARIREAAQSAPPGTWVIARGSPLQDERLRERRFPTKAELDQAAPEHPVYISFGAHVTVANSRALRERGITRDTPSPAGGTVVKDEQGEPTGVFHERAQFLLRGTSGDLDIRVHAERIRAELELAARRGTTCVHDIVWDRREIEAYQLLAREDRLPVRVQMIIRVIESAFSKESLLNLGFQHGFGSEMLRIGGIKMSIDGGFTGKNAAFSRPLETHDAHEHPGLIRIEQDELDETVWRYHEAGMRCCVHAIGDVAMDMILEAYDKALTRLPRPDHRHRVEHLGNWMITPERLERIKRLGILPMANPPFLFFFGDPLVEMLGKRATEEGFPFRSLWDAGFPLSFGSDGPGYYPVDPLRDLGTAVAHQARSGTKVNPREALTLDEALRTQTINAAYTGFVEKTQGSVEVGKEADFAVLGDDPFTVAPERFGELPIDCTIVGGRVVHSR